MSAIGLGTEGRCLRGCGRPDRGRAGLLFALLIAGAHGAGECGQWGASDAKPLVAKHSYSIVVNKANNTLKLFKDGMLARTYRVATGLYRCTIVGSFRVSDKRVVSKSGRGPLGSHWIGLNTKGRRRLKQVGIHGTNDPSCIGRYASLGCVRLRNADVAGLYAIIPLGTKVQIVDIPVPKVKPESDHPKAETARTAPSHGPRAETGPIAPAPPAVVPAAGGQQVEGDCVLTWLLGACVAVLGAAATCGCVWRVRRRRDLSVSG